MGTTALGHLRAALLAGIAVLGTTSAHAQGAAIALDDVNVTVTRLGASPPRSQPSAPSVSAATSEAPTPSATQPAVTPAAGPGPFEAAGILTNTITTGASSTVITAQEIERSPGTTVQDVLAREPGVTTSSLFGGVNGAQTSVDLRGFGVFATQNTLILINGRRITDIDLAGVDLSTLPKDSIDRIEITRGNSGAVLYGDNAVGGVINIITKTSVGLPPWTRYELGYGSFNQREGNVSWGWSKGPWSTTTFMNGLSSDGYRRNNQFDQVNGMGEVRYNVVGFSAFLNLSGDDQNLRLPGARRVDALTGQNQLVTDRRGATTPFNYADKQGINVTTGFTRQVSDTVELVVDGGVRHKTQQAGFFGNFVDPSAPDPMNYIDARLTTWSVTPRLNVQENLLGLPAKAIIGFDFYSAGFIQDRSLMRGSAPVHSYALAQTSLALYGQQKIAIGPDTDLAFGARGQLNRLTARDRYDPNAPALFPDVEATPLDSSEVQHALHGGFEHRFGKNFAVFGRLARSFRTPTVDERVGVSAFPVDFRLKTQTSRDAEAGVRFAIGSLAVQSSVYEMWLENELHFIPFPPLGADTNLDPTRRVGSETIAYYRVSDDLQFKGGLTYTHATFREGIYAGNEIPLVARWLANAGVSWNIWGRQLVFDGVVRYVGARFMDNDQRNVQPRIPAHMTVDLRLGGEVDRFFWSVSAQNIFNVLYYDYAVASPAVIGTYNAYPLPGRTFLLKAGVRFGAAADKKTALLSK